MSKPVITFRRTLVVELERKTRENLVKLSPYQMLELGEIVEDLIERKLKSKPELGQTADVYQEIARNNSRKALNFDDFEPENEED